MGGKGQIVLTEFPFGAETMSVAADITKPTVPQRQPVATLGRYCCKRSYCPAGDANGEGSGWTRGTDAARAYIPPTTFITRLPSCKRGTVTERGKTSPTSPYHPLFSAIQRLPSSFPRSLTHGPETLGRFRGDIHLLWWRIATPLD